jgi:hypothetical protein
VRFQNSKIGTRYINVVVIAHCGSCFDQIYLIGTTIEYRLDTPDVLLTDSMAIFEII